MGQRNKLLLGTFLSSTHQEQAYSCFLTPGCSDIHEHSLHAPHGSCQTPHRSSLRSIRSGRGNEAETGKVLQSWFPCTHEL